MNTAMSVVCVLHIMWQLNHIGDVTAIVFHCLQGCPFLLTPLTSLWRHDFSADMHSATYRRSMFRILFVHYLMNLSFYGVFGVVLQFVPLEQTKCLDANSTILLFFSILVKSTLLNWNKNNSSPNYDDKYERKYSFIGCYWIFGHSTLGVSKSCKTLGKSQVLHYFETPLVEWMAIYSMAAYERVL